MGGTFALLGGFVGLVGLAAMIARWNNWGGDPIGLVIFALLFVNGLIAVYRRVSGAEDRAKKRGPLSGGKR